MKENKDNTCTTGIGSAFLLPYPEGTINKTFSSKKSPDREAMRTNTS
ncbi:MAG: hypothetical protein JXA44_10010 [Methanospirillaceae archaeon]|nr:hypothetical protein [Methanospirillaceae archaeon]